MASTVTPVKTDSVEVLAHQAATHPVTIIGATQDVRTKRGVNIFMFHGYVEAAADTNPGHFEVQVRYEAGEGSAEESWVTIFEGYAKGTTPDDETLSGSESAGDASLAVASTTGFAIGDILYIQDVNVVADGEWNKLKTFVANTNIQMYKGLTNAKDNADKIFNDGATFTCGLDLSAIEAFQVLWTHEGAAGANGHVKAFAVYYDSDTIV